MDKMKKKKKRPGKIPMFFYPVRGIITKDSFPKRKIVALRHLKWEAISVSQSPPNGIVFNTFVHQIVSVFSLNMSLRKM